MTVERVRFRVDAAAVEALGELRGRLRDAGIGVPGDEPGVTVAAAGAVPPAAREALADELRVLVLPSIWLATLGTVAGRPDELVLAAVVDAELLAVHAADPVGYRAAVTTFLGRVSRPPRRSPGPAPG